MIQLKNEILFFIRKFISNEFQIFFLSKILNEEMCINEHIEKRFKKHTYFNEINLFILVQISNTIFY